MQEASPDELRRLMVKRTELFSENLKNIPDFLDGPGPTLLPLGAVLIYHAAIRLYGVERMTSLLEGMMLKHERLLGGLCVECGEKRENDRRPFCNACSKKEIV